MGKFKKIFFTISCSSLSFFLDASEQATIPTQLIGRGGSGRAFSSGWEGFLLNPAADWNKEKTVGAKIDIGLSPFFLMAATTDDPNKIADKLLAQIGKPYSLHLGATSGARIGATRFGFSIYDNLGIKTFFDLDKSGLESVAINREHVRDFNVGFSSEDRWKDHRFGLSLHMIQLLHGNISKPILSFAQDMTKGFKKSPIASPQTDYGFSSDLGYHYFLSEQATLGIVIENLPSVSFHKEVFGGKIDRAVSWETSTTLFSGYRQEIYSIPMALSLDLQDITRDETIWKKIHLGLEAHPGIFAAQIGLYQGNPSASLGLKADSFQWMIGYYTVELGKSIGVVSDSQVITSIAFEY